MRPKFAPPDSNPLKPLNQFDLDDVSHIQLGPSRE